MFESYVRMLDFKMLPPMRIPFVIHKKDFKAPGIHRQISAIYGKLSTSDTTIKLAAYYCYTLQKLMNIQQIELKTF